jgi:excisionase family DNA binding protein
MSEHQEAAQAVSVPEELLKRIEAMLRRLEESSAVKSRRAYPLKEAAQLLGISVSKLKGLIADREVKAVRIGKTRFVTDEEIRRVTAAKTAAPRQEARAPRIQPDESSPEDNSAAIRAALRKGTLY